MIDNLIKGVILNVKVTTLQDNVFLGVKEKELMLLIDDLSV